MIKTRSFLKKSKKLTQRLIDRNHLSRFFQIIVLLICFSEHTKSQITYSWTGLISSNWNSSLNWLPLGTPGSGDIVIISSTINSPLLDANRSVTNFTINSGTFNLNSHTLTVTGNAIFNNGNINNGTIAPKGSLALFNSTTFGAVVSASCTNILLNGSTFNNSATLIKSGSLSSFCTGNNTFNAATTIAVTGLGNLFLSNVSRDIYNADVTYNNSGSIIYIANNDATGTQFNGNIILNSSGTSGGFRFCQGTGTATLSNTKSISIGSGGFSSGNLNLRKFVQSGSATQTLTNFTGTTGLYLEYGNVFNGNVTFKAPSLLLNGTTFNGTALLEKSGTAYNYSQGGNTFNAATIITNSGSNELLLAGTTRDVFNGDVTFTSSGSSRINIAYNDAIGTLFNGNVFINSTGTSIGLNLCYGSGTATLAAGKTISTGTTGFSSGTFYIKDFKQLGTSSQSLVFTGSATMQFESGNVFNGNTNFSAPKITVRSNTFNGNAVFEKTGSGDNYWYGNNTFNGTTTIKNSGSGIMDLASTLGDDFNGDVNFIETASGRLSAILNGSSTFAGNISTVGSNGSVGFGYTWSSGLMIIDGSSVQNFNGDEAFPPAVKTLSLSSSNNTLNLNVGLQIYNDLINNGTLNDLSSGITLTGNSLQQIGGSSITTFKNLTLNNSAGVYLSTDEKITGALTISAGTFSTTGHEFTLVSDVNGTGSIAPVLGNFAGNITMQRYLGTGGTGWRFMASPVSNATINDWQDDFITSGFPGSLYPNYNFPSIYTYDETVGGICDNGYNVPTSASDPIEPGKGYWCYIGPVPLTIDLTGPPVVSNQTFQVSYTASGGTSEDGYVMIGNPYPSAIDWNSPAWSKNNINNAIYIWSPELQQYASWVSGVSTNGGSSQIASSQSFWIQTNAVNPSLSCTENVKVSSNPSFFKSIGSGNFDQLKLTLAGNNYSDETVVLFGDDATNGYDNALDARKLFSSNPQVPGISTFDSTLKDLSINSLPEINSQVNIPVKTIVGVSGNYTIALDSSSNMSLGQCIVLEDLTTGIKTSLNNVSSYTFNITDTTQAPRFVLHISAAAQVETQNTSCNNYQDGKAIAIGKGTGPWNYLWFNNTSSNLKQTVNALGADTISALGEGEYSVTISDNGNTCAAFTQTVLIGAPQPINAGFISNSTSLYVGNSLILQNTSTGGNKSHWDFGDGTAIDTSFTPLAHHYTAAGEFLITQIIRMNSCSDTVTKKIQVFSLDLTSISANGEEKKVKIYPTPFKDVVNLEMPEAFTSNQLVQIFDLRGVLMHEQRVNELKTQLDLGHFANGFYLLRLNNFTTKILKE